MDVDYVLHREQFRSTCEQGHPLIRHYEWECPLCRALRDVRDAERKLADAKRTCPYG